jgi:hypothetical protein
LFNLEFIPQKFNQTFNQTAEIIKTKSGLRYSAIKSRSINSLFSLFSNLGRFDPGSIPGWDCLYRDTLVTFSHSILAIFFILAIF